MSPEILDMIKGWAVHVWFFVKLNVGWVIVITAFVAVSGLGF